MIQVQKSIKKDKLLLSVTTEMDREDVEQLISDLQKWLDETKQLPTFKGIDEKAVKEAWEYSQSKRLMEMQMGHYIASIKPTQHVEKELRVIELDAINREVEITKTKLNERKKGI